ncbi:sugar phosphate isomerase/epimerase family protein [Actinokineospora fastidiosa]|uniref:Xylose isomerase-like TIM barrel domain-containing protein n=1 Tax=Actinokineospora fastidiosa TaxID=1816 RepID=A0A918LGW3_9PSEU|nr:sugar phosphate isomerase/epimerase [Actinokineospora fastidiosa]GGS45044.1 hypothetical protein GCM10010171_44980 [Actinokineospora fastidiosa]
MTPMLVVQTGIYGYGIFGSRAEENLEAALDLVRATGYDGIEVMTSLTGDPGRLVAACADRGLVIAGFHVFWHELDDCWEAARRIGAPRLILSGMPADSEENVRAALPALRSTAAKAREHGLRLLVHNHAEEARPLASGRSTLELLADELPAEDLGFVVDLHWASVAGDLARTIAATAGRCDYYHVKDGLIAEPENSRSFDLGAGEVDLAEGWRLATAAGPIAVAVVERGMPAEPLEPALRHDAAFVRGLFDQRPRVAPR